MLGCFNVEEHFLSEERQYPCGKCGEVFRSKVALRRHETYVCNNSNAIFSQLNRDFLESTNQQAAENNPEKKGDSAHGGEMIQEARHSADNSRDSSIIENEEERSEGGSSITGLKQFPCENCDKVFSDPSNLQRHIRSTHVGARSHACHECGKTFATSSGLKQHQHIHSSVKPFQCEVCLKAYTQFSNLCRHKRMHADCRQQIKCKDCGQAFSTMTSLSKHKRFCEGMLRNGARFSFPTAGPQSPEKTQPVNPVVSQASALTAAYMNFYGPRPPFPFYPPLGPGFPMFPPGHPLAAMTPQVLPEAKFPPSMTPTSSKSPRADLSPCTAPSPRVPSPAKTGEKGRAHMDGSEGSDLSDVSTPHSISVASDVDTDAGSDLESDSGYERSSIIQKKPIHNIHPQISPGITSPVKTSTPIYDLKRVKRERLESEAKRVKREEQPFDLSKSLSSSTGDQPLDLSVSKKSRESPIQETTPRKTHIFGGEVVKKPSPPTPPTEVESPEQKSPLHYAYPLANPMLMEQMYRMDKDKLRTFQEAARMMAMGPAARFPMHAPPYGAMPGMHGMMRSPMALDPTKAMMNPLLKLDRTPEYPYGGQKVKDRYACKFCGKIFPRSANLTRHLRTHTGEQPYKCKYCERSFSISSNLQRHVRNIHNKEKPFKCPLCDRCFGQQTNLDRHLKKHETEGPNVMDSPTNQEADLEDKDESYFDEIRNFIGKATKSDPDEPSSSPRREYDHIDANFSITAQIEKQNKMSNEKHLEKFDDSFDEDHHANDEDNEGVDVESIKEDRADNNNSNREMLDLPNGYHSNEEDVISKHANHPLSLAISS